MCGPLCSRTPLDQQYFTLESLCPLLNLIFHPSSNNKQLRKSSRPATDNLIENAHSLIAKYNAIKQGMMRDLFTRGVEKDGNLRPFYNESPQKYCETPFGYIPKDWKIDRLPEVCSYQTGKAFPSVQYRDAGIPLLRPGNLQADEYVVWDKGHTICLPHFWADVAKDYLVYVKRVGDEFDGTVIRGRILRPRMFNRA